MRSLHVTNTDKFIQPYIKFINKYFNTSINPHVFSVVIKNKEEKFNVSYQNVKYIYSNYTIRKLIKQFYNYDRIYLHGLFNMKVILILFLQPWLLKKCSWIIWGDDLYRYREKRTTFKSKMYEYIRGKVIKNMGCLLPLVEGDYYLARKWYGAKGTFKIARYNNLRKNNYATYLMNKTSLKSRNREYINIHIGNSATASNNHMEILNTLEKYKKENIKIYCPLVYGDLDDYAKTVEEYGKRIFGSKFIVINKMMDIEAYLDHLHAMDIGIFNNDRQQGLGNITPLLFFGKKVFFKDDTTMWKYYKKDNLNIYKFDSIKKKTFSEFIYMPLSERKINYEILKERFTDVYSVGVWEDIFINTNNV